MARYEGRLELTWTNKQLRLLADDDGAYTWVSPSDYRVAEVRLLHGVEAVGECHSEQERTRDNLLIRGDALDALRSLAALPEFAQQYAGRVRLAYLDPPFNTQQSFLQYDDALEHSVWLTMMRDRLVQIRDLLHPSGTVWVHLDDSEVAYCRVMMDELFGREHFLASVIWEKTDSPRMDAAYFSSRHDTILVYRKSAASRLNRLPASDLGEHYSRADDHGRRYAINPLRARGQAAARADRPTLYYALQAPDGSEVFPKLPSGGDSRWRWSRARVERDGHLIEWLRGRRGWTPYYRIYEPEERLRPAETIWPHSEVGSTRTSAAEVKRLLAGQAFATPKPERLIARILTIGTAPGDIVLDCFLGSGTTAAVAHKMGRRWVGIEREGATLDGFAIPRLRKVVAGEDEGGVTETLAWEGGGGLRVIEVAPSMFAAHEGQVFLSEWATNGKLAEATAAQLSFDYVYEPPVCGVRGRSRLAVIDGLVNEDVVRLISRSLADTERAVVCGTAVDPAARDLLRELRPGSFVQNPAVHPARLPTDEQDEGPRPI